MPAVVVVGTGSSDSLLWAGAYQTESALTTYPNHVDSARKADLSWVFSAVQANDLNGISAIGSVIDGVNDLIRNRDFGTLDRVLKYVGGIKNTSKHVLVALARATAPMEEKLANWREFVLNVEEDFKMRGLDYGRLLRGLI